MRAKVAVSKAAQGRVAANLQSPAQNRVRIGDGRRGRPQWKLHGYGSAGVVEELKLYARTIRRNAASR